MRRFVLLPLAALGVAACGSPYVYHPAENATANVAGRQAAHYDLPSSQNPLGDIRVASFGVAKIKSQDPAHPEIHAMHVREVVSNNSDRNWYVDTRQQALDLRTGQQLAPAYARSDGDGLPVAVVPPGGKRTLDLFYPLPPQEEKESRIPSFDVVWRVDLGGQQVAERTPFERLRIEPYYASTVWGPWGWGWGPYGWYDPFWGPAFIGAPGWYW